MKYIIPALLLGCSITYAEINKSGAKAATSRKEFCTNTKNKDYFKSLLYSRDNQIAFTNRGGLMNGGVCWWHSLLTRSAQYLTVYKPELPRPNSDQVQRILTQISAAKGVVEVPGYRNFNEFTRDNAQAVQTYLEAGQIVDGGFAFGWIRGISGAYEVEPEVLSKMMDETYKSVKSQKQIAYQKLQIQGVESHAWLVLDMTKTHDGYELDVVDSNYRGVRKASFRHGMRQLPAYRSVPYTSRNAGHYRNFDWAINQYCKYGRTAEDLDTSSQVLY